MAEAAQTEAEMPVARSRTWLVLAVAIPALLLLGGGAGAWVAGLIPFASEVGEDPDAHAGDGEATHHAEQDAAAAESEVTFVELPDVLVNLRSDGGRMRFLKLKVAVEVGQEETADRVRQFMPRVMDGFQMYLRALAPTELQGAAALYRLKEDLIARVNNAIGPARINDVLFKEMLVQ